jgi:hypothetical protein
MKTPGGTAKTERSKYSGKYALSEILTCAECGSPYRRVTWTQRGEYRAVWRCVSRLEHGRKFCRGSPTLDETALQAAILDAVSGAADQGLLAGALGACVQAAQNADARTAAYLTAKRRVSELDALLDKYLALSVTAGADEGYYDGKCREVVSERTGRQALIAEYEAKHTQTQTEFTLTEPITVTQFDERLARQLLSAIKVHSDGKLQITLKGGEMIERTVPTNQRETHKWQTQQYAASQQMS